MGPGALGLSPPADSSERLGPGQISRQDAATRAWDFQSQLGLKKSTCPCHSHCEIYPTSPAHPDKELRLIQEGEIVENHLQAGIVPWLLH